MIEIINIHKTKIKDYVFCGRGSVLGNPYHITKEHGRNFVIKQYQKWFYEQINKHNPEVIKQINRIKTKLETDGIVYLGCYCHPLSCHTEVIKDYIEKHYKNSHL